MNMKKIIAGVIACCIVGGTIPFAVYNVNVPCAVAVNYVYFNSSDYKTYGQLKYKDYGDHIEITSCDKEATEVEIPAEIEGVPVTAIGAYAFQFGLELTSIEIPASITEIKEHSFANTPWLEERRQENPLVIVNGILVDGMTCSGDVVIPENVTKIAKSAFCDASTYPVKASGLTSVIIPDSITSIEDLAFSNCENLKSVTIPASVTDITGNPFANTPWLEEKRQENPLVIVNDILIDGQTCSGNVVIPENITSIGNGVFSGSSLTSVTIHDRVTSIGQDAFLGCKSLTSIEIPDSVTSIGFEAFCNSGLTSVIIPDSITEINDYAFSGCTDLKSVTIPNSVTSIEDFAFSRCENLTSIEIPASVESIGSSAFARSGLTSITIPDSVTKIGIRTFEACSGLTSVTIPDSVASIGVCAFANCSGLTSITILNPDCKINDSDKTISNSTQTIPGENGGISTQIGIFDGTIYGYENSTAQAYAEKYERTFVSLGGAPETTGGNALLGDTNEDGAVDIADATAIVQHMGNPDEYGLSEQGKINADIVNKGDGVTGADAVVLQLLEAKKIKQSEFPITMEQYNGLLSE